MSVLIGDTNADGFVDAVDTSQTKSQSGNAVSASNYREDVNVDGFIDAVDVSLVKSKSGSALPVSSPAPATPPRGNITPLNVQTGARNKIDRGPERKRGSRITD